MFKSFVDDVIQFLPTEMQRISHPPAKKQKTEEQSETKEQSEKTKSRPNFYVPKEGDDVMVQLIDWGDIPPEYRKKSSYLKLHEKKNPVRYTIIGIGVGTYTFRTGMTAQKKPIFGELCIDHVIPLWLAEDVEQPELENGMLIEVQHIGPDEVKRWSLLRYIDALRHADGKQRFVVTEDKNLDKLLDTEIYEFSAEHDEWRFPTYISLKEGDVIECFINDAWQKVTVMENVYDQTWACEYAPHWSKKRVENEIEIDVYKTQIRSIESDAKEPPKDEEYTYDQPEVESDDDRGYSLNEYIEYNGVDYTIIQYNKETGNYTLEPKKGGPEIELTEDYIDNQWSPNFEMNEEVMYEGRCAVITGIDWTQRAYIIEDADGKAHTTADVGAYTPLAYAVGRHVVYEFRYCEIVYVDNLNLRYTLESGDLPPFEGVSEDDLSNWCIFQKPNKASIIYKIFDNNFQKAVKRGGKSVKKRHYKLLSEEESRKKKPKLKVAVDGDNIKKQSEVEAVYQDMAEYEDLGVIYGYVVEDRVTYDGKNATVLSQTAKNRYTIQVDGEKEPQEVDGQDLMHIKPEVAEEDRTRYNKGDCKYVDEDMWVVTSVEGGLLDWVVVEPKDGDEIVDVEGVQWKYDEDEGWQPSGDDPTDDTDEDEVEPDYEYDEEDIVHLDNSEELYCVTRRSAGPVYTIESVTDEENTQSGITEDRLQKWTAVFEVLEEVVVVGDLYESRVVKEVGEGLYELDDGSEVAESELSKYVKPIANGKLVKVGGKLYRVQSFAGGVYQLTRLMDSFTLAKNVDEVDEREVPDYNEKDWVVVKGEVNPEQVTKVNIDNGTYQLSDKRIFFESQLEDAPEPGFGTLDKNGEKYVPDADQRVSVRDHQVQDEQGNDIPLKIKKVLRGTREYVVVDGREGRKKGEGGVVSETTVGEDELYECPTPEPDFEVGQEVLVGDTVAQIKKIRPWAREYVLKDGRIVHEDDIHEDDDL